MKHIAAKLSFLTIVFTAACAAPASSEVEGTVASADRALGTNLVFRKLTTPVTSTVVTPIGQTEADVLRRETESATRTSSLSATSCVETFANGPVYIEHIACGSDDHFIRVWTGGEYTTRGYTLKNGKVSSFHSGDGSTAWQLWASDKNGDGKLWELDQAIATTPDFTVTGYSELGWTSTKQWFRLLFDTNGDGQFDVEGVTGDWTCVTADPAGCDSGSYPR